MTACRPQVLSRTALAVYRVFVVVVVEISSLRNTQKPKKTRDKTGMLKFCRFFFPDMGYFFGSVFAF
jgi:RPA family protein